MKKIFLITLVLIFFCFTHSLSAQQRAENIGIINASARYLPFPRKTKKAGNACVGGKVEVKVKYHAFKGSVISAKAISGNKLLWKSSEKAARKAIFAESNINGNRNFYITGIIVYNFAQPKCVGDNILNKKAKNIPKPQVSEIPENVKINYPQTIFVQISVDNNGNVTSAKAVSGHPLLRPACEGSARQAKFPSNLVNTKFGNYAVGLLQYKFKSKRDIKF